MFDAATALSLDLVNKILTGYVNKILTCIILRCINNSAGAEC